MVYFQGREKSGEIRAVYAARTRRERRERTHDWQQINTRRVFPEQKMKEDKKFEQVVQKLDPQSKLLRTWELKGGVSAQVTALEAPRVERKVGAGAGTCPAKRLNSALQRPSTTFPPVPGL